jgi:hypothetical protein
MDIACNPPPRLILPPFRPICYPARGGPRQRHGGLHYTRGRCGILAEATAPVIYQAPFGAYIQESPASAAPLHGFAPDLAVIAHLAISVSPAEADAALQPKVGLFATLWDRLGATGTKIIQHTLAPPTAQYCGFAEWPTPSALVNQVRRPTRRCRWPDTAACTGWT